jgi:hypothetical protein
MALWSSPGPSLRGGYIIQPRARRRSEQTIQCGPQVINGDPRKVADDLCNLSRKIVRELFYRLRRSLAPDERRPCLILGPLNNSHSARRLAQGFRPGDPLRFFRCALLAFESFTPPALSLGCTIGTRLPERRPIDHHAMPPEHLAIRFGPRCGSNITDRTQIKL